MARKQLRKGIALVMAAGLLAPGGAGQGGGGDPHGCECSPTPNFIVTGPNATPTPPLFGCGKELVLLGVEVSGAPCTLDCEPLSPPSICLLTVDLVYWDSFGLSTVVDQDVVLRAGCGSTNKKLYRCPTDPVGVQVGFELICSPDCEPY